MRNSISLVSMIQSFTWYTSFLIRDQPGADILQKNNIISRFSISVNFLVPESIPVFPRSFPMPGAGVSGKKRQESTSIPTTPEMAARLAGQRGSPIAAGATEKPPSTGRQGNTPDTQCARFTQAGNKAASAPDWRQRPATACPASNTVPFPGKPSAP